MSCCAATRHLPVDREYPSNKEIQPFDYAQGDVLIIISSLKDYMSAVYLSVVEWKEMSEY